MPLVFVSVFVFLCVFEFDNTSLNDDMVPFKKWAEAMLVVDQ